MSASEFHESLHEMASLIERFVQQLEQGIEAFARNDEGGADVAALRRARTAAQCAAGRMREVAPELIALRNQRQAAAGRPQGA